MPADLVGRLRNERGAPTRELRRSLKTSELREARRVLPSVLMEWQELFDRERRAVSQSTSSIAPVAPPDSSAETHILRQVYDRMLALDLEERQAWPTTDDAITAARSTAERHNLASDQAAAVVAAAISSNGAALADRLRDLHEKLPMETRDDLVASVADIHVGENASAINTSANVAILEDLREGLARGDSSSVAEAADHLLSESGYALPRESPEFKRFAHKLMRAMADVWERKLERDRGVFSGKPADDVLVEVVPAPPPAVNHVSARQQPHAKRDLSEWFDRYAQENRNGIKDHSLEQARQSVRWLSEFLNNKPASEIAKADIAEWIDALRSFPTRAALISEFKGLTFSEIVAASQEQGRQALKNKTIRRMVSEVSGFFRWMENRGYIDRNPASGQTPRPEKSPRKVRRSFSAAELQSLFRSPLFTGNAGAARRHLPGSQTLRDGQFWMPLLALYTGARMGELAQLHADDVFQRDGVWVVSITDVDLKTGDAVDGKSLKTSSSRRLVPLHTSLVDLGFPEFVSSALGPRLFPELQRNDRGEFSAYSREFARYLKRIGLKLDGGLTFHSFRHTFMDALRRGGVRKDQRELLAGHTRYAMNDLYGEVVDGTVLERRCWIDKLDFEGVDPASTIASVD